MRLRKLGKDGPTVSALGLGCMGMSEFYGPANEDEAVSTLQRALDLEVNFFDTADVYGMGRNEELVGRALRRRREDVVLATKFGNVRGNDGAFVGLNGRPEYVRHACDASLMRLRVEVIDLYYLHRVDPETPIEETVGAMSRLIEEGKVRYLGLSEASAATLRRAHAIFPITALQTEHSLWTRDVEEEILPTCRELGIGFVPYSPLGRGFLTGAIASAESLSPDDARRRSPRFEDENLRQNLKIAERVKEAARAKGCTPAQLALAWLLAQGEDLVPIPGTKRRRYLDENIGALDVELTRADLERIGEAIPAGMARGTRYPERMMHRVNV